MTKGIETMTEILRQTMSKMLTQNYDRDTYLERCQHHDRDNETNNDKDGIDNVSETLRQIY
jgi:hypothetical protein